MLKKHSQFFANILFIADIVIIALSWLASYYLRFYSKLIPVDKGIPDLKAYLLLLAPITVIWMFAFKGFGLYRPKRIGTHLGEVFDVTKACAVSVMILIAFTFFVKLHDFSRGVFVFFTVINILALSVERWLFRDLIRYLRKKGHNLRYAVIVGTGESARELLARLDGHPEVGIKVVGMIGSGETAPGEAIGGVNVYGPYGVLRSVILEKRIDHVFVALPWEEHSRIVEVLGHIGDEAVDIKVIPDIFEFITLGGGVEDFDGLPILNLQNTPLYGWNLILKRAADIILSSVFIIILSPVLAALALLIRITSPGPVLYRQERMGIGGDTFQMLKFRSMRVDAEVETGAVWARENDPRRTRLGSFLRATSLDELPQFFNVLKGDMSIVGPRPERPVFIKEFRHKIPRYMLRHKMKAGITGWAQVNGWRGNTDLKKRIEHDLYYIEHWSLAFDIKIIWLTIWKGLINKNAY